MSDKTRSKKFCDEWIDLSEGRRIKISIHAKARSGFGPLSIFYTTTPWDKTIEADTIKELIRLAILEYEKNMQLKKEKVIGIAVDGDPDNWSFNDLDEKSSANLALSFRVFYRAIVDDDEIFWDMDNTRAYSTSWCSVFIPWTQKAEDTLSRGIKSIHAIRDGIAKIINNKNLPELLETGNTRLLPEYPITKKQKRRDTIGNV